MNEIEKLTKKQQLKTAFRGTLREFTTQLSIYIKGRDSGYRSVDEIIDNCVNLLLKEVSIRTPIK